MRMNVQLGILMQNVVDVQHKKVPGDGNLSSNLKIPTNLITFPQPEVGGA